MSKITLAEKTRLLRDADLRFVKLCTNQINRSEGEGLIPTDIMGYGTTIDEKITNRNEFFGLLDRQIEEMSKSTISFEHIPVFERILNDGDTGIFVCEVLLDMKSDDYHIKYVIRLSTCVSHIDGAYKLVHWHGSAPIMSENDTFHVKDLQGKTEKLEQQVKERTAELQASLEKLRSAQEQLIVQEKLASLGQLAAGIAHEIKNPMNFVNNFAELSIEYVDELRTELVSIPASKHTTEMDSLLNELESNLKKIHQHGTRADNIVKSMLMHSRGGTGVMEPTNLNELISEYVNLSFHGMRAGKTAINSKITLDLDPHLPPVALNVEDFSRVVLNICKNAFDAMRQKTLEPRMEHYLPELKATTVQKGEIVEMVISDNGPGVPDSIRQKLFDPFFTTKKGTEGTGLGLSITNDIIKAHGGTILIESQPGEYTRFIITLPIKQPKS